MKKLIIIIAVLILAVPAMAQDSLKTSSVGGYGMAYGIKGEASRGAMFAHGFVGTRVLSYKTGDFYVVYQRADVIEAQDALISGNGGMLLYGQPLKYDNSWRLWIDAGVLFDFARDADGSRVPAATLGCGLTWTCTNDLGLAAFLKWWDFGADFNSMLYGAVYIKDPARLAKPVVGIVKSGMGWIYDKL